MRFLKDLKPDWLILAGDYLDCWELSDFKRMKTTNKNSFEKEAERGREILEWIRRAIPNAKITLIEGNHEFRFKKCINSKAPEFAWMVNIEHALNLAKYNVEYVQLKEGMDRWSNCYVEVGDLLIGHFDTISKHGGYTAKMLVDTLGVSLMQAHCHRFGAHARTYADRIIVAYENMCMCLKPQYESNPNWVLGWSVVYLNKRSGETNVYPIVLKGYNFIFNGKQYR